MKSKIVLLFIEDLFKNELLITFIGVGKLLLNDNIVY